MSKIQNTSLPKGATKLIIHELKKAAQNVNYAITETIDDALDAVNHAPNASIQITYDGEKLVVSDFGHGTGMAPDVCKNIIERFYSHHFANIGISKFGLGRNYPFATIPNHPNMTYETSIGNGMMCKVTSEIPDVNKEEWIKSFSQVPCEKGIKGTSVTYNDVSLSKNEVDNLIKYLTQHYALSKPDIYFNGTKLDKFCPIYVNKLPNGIDTSDGIYCIDGFVFKVDTHCFKNNNSIVRIKTIAVSLTQVVFKNNEIHELDSNSAKMGGVYTGIESNILNKGDNADEFFGLTFTRGGSGATRFYVRVLQDDDNILRVDDVKAKGFAPFVSNRKTLNEYSNENGGKLYDTLFQLFRQCRDLYNKLGQNKHIGYTDEERYRIACEVYYGNKHNSVKQSKTVKTVRQASKNAHVEYMEKMFDYVTTNDKGLFSVSIPKNVDNELKLEINAKNLPSNWSSITKEEVLNKIAKFFIEEKNDPNLFHSFNNWLKW